jgi:uncharacterized protein
MNICLKTAAAHSASQQVSITVSERLPYHIVSDCTLNCDYFVRAFADYYVLTLEVSGIIPIHCLRCLEVFKYNYSNHTELALCRDEAMAENLMESYECIVCNQDEADLACILTDELHLYVPEKHPDLIDCNHEIGCNPGNN